LLPTWYGRKTCRPLLALNRGNLNSAHIRGTHVPVEEPSTASLTELRSQPDFRATHAEEAFPTRSSELRNQMIAALREAALPG
jgi:hypothetical protein